MNLKERDDAYIAHTYKRFPIEIVSGKGSVVYDNEGKRYIDLGSGIAVTSFGISDDVWVKAVTDQLSKVQHMSNLYYTEPCVDLAELLCQKSGMKKVFFSNSVSRNLTTLTFLYGAAWALIFLISASKYACGSLIP